MYSDVSSLALRDDDERLLEILHRRCMAIWVSGIISCVGFVLSHLLDFLGWSVLVLIFSTISRKATA